MDCQHLQDLGLVESSDKEIWDYANQNGYVVVSKDEDFCHFVNARSSEARFVWIRVGNCRTKTLLTLMERIWPTVLRELEQGERLIEIR